MCLWPFTPEPQPGCASRPRLVASLITTTLFPLALPSTPPPSASARNKPLPRLRRGLGDPLPPGRFWRPPLDVRSITVPPSPRPLPPSGLVPAYESGSLRARVWGGEGATHTRRRFLNVCGMIKCMSEQEITSPPPALGSLPASLGVDEETWSEKTL